MKGRNKIGKIILYFTVITAVCTGVMILISVITSGGYFDEKITVNDTDRSSILDIDDGLTFARFRKSGKVYLILVSEYSGGKVRGTVLYSGRNESASDPIEYFRKFGYNAISVMKDRGKQVAVNAHDLIVPALFGKNNIAVGLNYPLHAKEVKLDYTPFFFPKVSEITSAISEINVNGLVLPDYEAELGFVVLEDITEPEQKVDYLGFVLVNDFSDRWPLVKVKINELTGLKHNFEAGQLGYPLAKNGEGFCPVGNLFIIARNYRELYRKFEIKLFRNGLLQQKVRTERMIWGPDRCIREIFRRRNLDYFYGEKKLKLLPGKGVIERGTIILSGTGRGVILRKTNWWNPFIFLYSGETVIICGDGLGVIVNNITDKRR